MSSPQSPEGRPAPRYGEYADVPPVAVPAPAPAPHEPALEQAPARGGNTLSLALLVFGGMSAFYAIATALGIADFMQQLYTELDAGTYTPGAGQTVVQVTIILSHVVLFVAAVRQARRRIAAGRNAVWVPVVFGAIAAVVFWGSLVALAYSDPAVLDAVMQRQGVL